MRHLTLLQSEIPSVKYTKEIVPEISGHSENVFIFSISLLIIPAEQSALFQALLCLFCSS